MPHHDLLAPSSGGSRSSTESAPPGNLRTPAIIALIVVPLILAGAALLLFRDFRESAALRAEVRRSYETHAELQQAFSLLQDVETGARGYTITGNPAFLGPYRQARARLPSVLDHLDQLIGYDADQRLRLVRLKTMAAAKIEQAGLIIRTREMGGLSAATAVVSTGKGKALMDTVRAIVSEMTAADETTLQQVTAESDYRTERVRQLVIALFIFLAAVVVFAAWIVWRNDRHRQALLNELNQTATRQRAVFNSATDGLVLLNPSGSIESINRSGERMFGRRSEYLARRDIGLLLELAPDQEGSFLQRLGVTGADLDKGVLKELSGLRSDGTTFPVSLALGAMELPDGLHVVAAIRDVSERKRAERLKDEFVSTVSHELRTPLTSIAGSLGLLAGGAGGELPERAGRLIGIAHANCQRLVRLINDILDIEKIESGKLRFESVPISLADLARRAIDGLRGYGDQLGVQIELFAEEDSIVRGDADRLIQVITNVASNALKFSPRSCVVEVRLTRSTQGPRLSVRDQGPGIPDEFKSRIFSKFAQADSSDTRQKGGTGLGLAIAKEIVERHGGRLSFETAAGEGSTFHIDLPALDNAQSDATHLRGERLLLCEDDADIAAVMREALEGAGFRIDVAGTIGEARKALTEVDRYAAVLMDLQLPDGDGISFIRELRGAAVTRDLPIIVVSAYVEKGRDAAKAHPLNVVDWMEKPLDVQRLREVVQGVLMRSSAKRPTILHVDDDQDILHVTAATLAGIGEIVPAENLAAARDFLRTRVPQLVILDLGLPDGSGLELLPSLNDRRGAPIPVVVFSAQDMDRQVLRSTDVALTKSRTSLAQLAQTVRHLVRVQASATPEE